MANTRRSLLKFKPKKFKVGDIISIRYAVQHPMHTGMLKDEETKKIIPAEYITDISFSFEDEEFSTMKVWESISATPSFELKYKVTGAGEIKVQTIDNLGNEILKTKKLEPQK